MAASSQPNRPVFANSKDLVKFLNDKKIGTLSPLWSIPLELGIGNPELAPYISTLVSALRGEVALRKDQMIEIDTFLRANAGSRDYQFLRRALDNNGVTP